MADKKRENESDTAGPRVWRALQRLEDAAWKEDGWRLTGFSVRMSGDFLLVLKRTTEGGLREVAFVGGSSLDSCFTKAEVALRTGDVRWREDAWGK